MQCHEFDGLLADAIDGVLAGVQLDAFQVHARSCSACGPLLSEVKAGRNWLKDLTEAEPPASLVNSILASTTGVDTQRLRANVPAAPSRVTWWERAQAWISGGLQTVRQPRFVMSFGMAFFSLSVALSVLGVKPADLRQLSLRPTAIRHTFYNTQARVVRYYDNIRFVYELQAAASRIKRNVAPAEPGSRGSGPGESAPAKEKEHKNDTTQQPEQKQDRNYSQHVEQLMLAGGRLGPSVNDSSINEPSVVSVTTYRRFV